MSKNAKTQNLLWLIVKLLLQLICNFSFLHFDYMPQSLCCLGYHCFPINCLCTVAHNQFWIFLLPMLLPQSACSWAAHWIINSFLALHFFSSLFFYFIVEIRSYFHYRLWHWFRFDEFPSSFSFLFIICCLCSDASGACLLLAFENDFPSNFDIKMWKSTTTCCFSFRQ